MDQKKMREYAGAALILIFLLGLMGLLSSRYRRFQSTHLQPLYGEKFGK